MQSMGYEPTCRNAWFAENVRSMRTLKISVRASMHIYGESHVKSMLRRLLECRSATTAAFG